jgi:hypothetical protein
MCDKMYINTEIYEYLILVKTTLSMDPEIVLRSFCKCLEENVSLL